MKVNLEGATTLRRSTAALIDVGACLFLCLLPMALLGVEHPLMTSSPGRFWPDYLLELLASSPDVFLRVVIGFLSVVCLWEFSWLAFLNGQTLGMRATGLRVVDRYGDSLGSNGCLVRVLGHVLSAFALGLGWMWVYVSPDRRSWPDLLSRRYIVRY